MALEAPQQPLGPLADEAVCSLLAGQISSTFDLFDDALEALTRTWGVGRSVWSWSSRREGRGGPCRRQPDLCSLPGQLSALAVLLARVAAGTGAQQVVPALGNPLIPPWLLWLSKS